MAKKSSRQLYSELGLYKYRLRRFNEMAEKGETYYNTYYNSEKYHRRLVRKIEKTEGKLEVARQEERERLQELERERRELERAIAYGAY